MANEGYTDIAATTQDTLRFSWRVVSQSTENNTTTLAWEMLLIAAAQGYIQSSYSKDWSVTVAGKTYSGTNKVAIGNNSQKVLASGTTEISHNADGTKSFSYYFSQQFNIYWTGKLVRTVDGSGSGTLPNIARATTPVLSPASQVMGSAISISLPRASEAFTHTLQYFFGSASGTIASGAAASASWTVPASLAAQLPGAASGTGTIRCITYNGASQVGARDVSFTASVPSSLVPSISGVTVTDTQSAVASAFGAFVQGKSTLKVVTQAAGVSGSTISSCKVSYQGKTYSGTSVSNIPVTGSGTQTVSVTVTDSRGRTAASSKTVTVLAYSSPTIAAFSAARCNSSGSLDDNGSNVKVTMNFSISPCGNKNTKSYKIEYRAAGDSGSWHTAFSGSAYSYSSSQVIGGDLFDMDLAYSIRLTVADFFSSITSVIELPTAFTLIDLYSSGKGMAFGKVAAKDGLENALEVWHTKPCHFGGQIYLSGYFGQEKSLLDFLMPVGTVREFSNSTDPNALYPGTAWERFGAGRFTVGVNSGDSDFSSPGATGGSKTNTHYHWTKTGFDGEHVYVTDCTEEGNGPTPSRVSTLHRAMVFPDQISAEPDLTREGTTYESELSLLPPYIAVSRWVRTK